MLSADPTIFVYRRVASHFATCVWFALPLLFLIGALPARADQRAAILHPVGSVTVNDVPATRPIPILVGDQIVTGHGATATIISEGTQVAMAPDSTIVYTKRQVMVLRNSAVITTLNGMAARTGALTISPVSQGSASQFEITRGNFGTRVTAATGSVAIVDASGSVQLAAGNSVVRDAASSLGPSATATSEASKIPAPKDSLSFSVLGNNKNCPPRRCKRPPESPTHHCHPTPPGWGGQGQNDSNGWSGGGSNGNGNGSGGSNGGGNGGGSGWNGGGNGGGNNGGDPDHDCRCRDHDDGFQP